MEGQTEGEEAVGRRMRRRANLAVRKEDAEVLHDEVILLRDMIESVAERGSQGLAGEAAGNLEKKK